METETFCQAVQALGRQNLPLERVNNPMLATLYRSVGDSSSEIDVSDQAETLYVKGLGDIGEQSCAA